MFGASATCCFLLLQARVAHSYYWANDAWASCNGASEGNQTPRLCPLMQSTKNFPVGSLTTGCATFGFDPYVLYDNYLIKQSSSGSLYQDWNTWSSTTSGIVTVCVGAGNVKANPSAYDYLYYKEAIDVGYGLLLMKSVRLSNSL